MIGFIPFIGKTDHFVKNSRYLAGDFASLSLDEDDVMVSHDVASLHVHEHTYWRISECHKRAPVKYWK